MCQTVGVSRSGFYAWLDRPPSNRERENHRLAGLIRQSWEASGRTYGAPRVSCDLWELGETCGQNRVARIMQRHQIQAQRGYKKPG